MNNIEKVPPYDAEAERAVIGSLLIDGETIHEARNMLCPEDFMCEDMKWMYQASLEICNRGEVVNQITVANELIKMGKLDEVGGASTLSRLVVEVPTSLHIVSYANVVKKHSIQRHTIKLSYEIASLAYSETDSNKIIDGVGKKFLHLQSLVETPMLTTPQKWADSLTERYGALYHGDKKIAYSTGIDTLDALTGGLYPEYVVLAGFAGSGKTTVKQQLADIIQPFGNVLDVSLEMSKEDIGDRRVASMTQEKIMKIRRGRYNEDLMDRITDSVGKIAESNIYYYGHAGQRHSGGVTTASIESIASYMKLSIGLACIFVDYIQILRDLPAKSQYERTTHISGQLQNLCRTLDVPVIALSQFSRGLMQRPDRMPMLSDLKDSGAIENDADMVLLMHRESAYQDIKAQDRRLYDDEADLIVAKQRQGDEPGIKIPMEWNPKTRKYHEVTERKKEGYIHGMYYTERPQQEDER